MSLLRLRDVELRVYVEIDYQRDYWLPGYGNLCGSEVGCGY